jgi:hypothetical protein
MSQDDVDADGPHARASQMRHALRTIEEHLDNERRRIAAEITSYPSPIPACDAQFNHLLEQRERVAQDLERVGVLRAADRSSRAAVGRVVDLLANSPFITAEQEQSLRLVFEQAPGEAT